MDIGIEIETKVKTIEKGIIAVPAHVLLSVLSSIKENDLVLETKDNNLKIITNKNSVVIKCMPSEDFPSIPKIENHIPPSLFLFIIKIEIIPNIKPTGAIKILKSEILIIFDCSMPPIGTIHTSRVLREIKPRIKLITASLLFISQ